MGHNQRAHCGPIQAKVHKEKYAAQRPITERNRISKRLKHVRSHPNDLQAKST